VENVSGSSSVELSPVRFVWCERGFKRSVRPARRRSGSWTCNMFWWCRERRRHAELNISVGPSLQNLCFSGCPFTIVYRRTWRCYRMTFSIWTAPKRGNRKWWFIVTTCRQRCCRSPTEVVTLLMTSYDIITTTFIMAWPATEGVSLYGPLKQTIIADSYIVDINASDAQPDRGDE